MKTMETTRGLNKFYELEIDCKKEETAKRNFVKLFPECDWIMNQDSENGICSSEYDSYIIDNDIENHFYICAVIWNY